MNALRRSYELLVVALTVLCPLSFASPFNPNLGYQIKTFLSGRSSPLAGNNLDFLQNGVMYNVDPRLIVAIAGAESSFGTNWVNCAAPPNGFNAWSWFYAGNPPNCPDFPFSSFADGINTVTKFMRRSYLNKGRTTIALIGQRYCSSGCQHWVPNVTTYYSSLGGDTSDLAFVNLFGQWAGTARLTDETGTETLQVSATFLLISGNSFTGTVAVTEPGEMADLNTLTYQALSPTSFTFTNNASPMLTTASGSITVTPGQAVLSGSGMDNDPNDPTTGVGSDPPRWTSNVRQCNRHSVGWTDERERHYYHKSGWNNDIRQRSG